jgi:hypothetical protein
MKWKVAAEKLWECEADLRRLLAEAANEGDYPSVLRITEWARAISALAAEAGNDPPGASDPAPPRKSPVASEVVAGNGRKPRSKTDKYPQFFRRGDELVKVGWSKKDRKEYCHRAARRAIDAVALSVRQVGTKGRMFTGDKLLPLKDTIDGARIADYQAYVALAWLKQLGIVEQHGRKSGYTLVPDKQIDSIVMAAWPELAEWRG